MAEGDGFLACEGLRELPSTDPKEFAEETWFCINFGASTSMLPLSSMGGSDNAILARKDGWALFDGRPLFNASGDESDISSSSSRSGDGERESGLTC